MSTTDFRIKQATIDDLNLVQVLSITTCYDAYFELDPSKDLADYCAFAFNSDQLKTELLDNNSTFFIAELNNRAVGYAKLRKGKKVECLTNKNAIEIQRIYVLEKLKGQGIGEKLMQHCFEIAKNESFEIIWLGVWDKNIKAQKFYEKIGMKNIGTTDFSDGKNEFINFVYAKEII